MSTCPEKLFQNMMNTRIIKNVLLCISGDIDGQQIQYVLNPGENSTSDSFFFKIADKGGKT